MSASRDAFSPAESWETQSEEMDDDMDYELASDDITSTGDEEDEAEGHQTIYFDAEEGTLRDEDGEEISFEVEGEGEDEEEDEGEEGGAEEGEEGAQTPQPTTATQGTRTINMTQAQLLQLLSHAGLRGLFQTGITTRSQGRTRHAALEDDDEDDDDELQHYGSRRRRAARRSFAGDRYPPIPSEEGGELMQSGTFGNNDRCLHSACGEPLNTETRRHKRKLAYRMLDREMGVENRGRAKVLGSLASQDLIPGSKADLIINLNARCYSGQFSEDGSFFFACGQDFKVRMYDTSNPYDWKYYKTVHYYGGQWTITDASLSPDNKLLAYSSIRSQICLARTEQGDQSEPQLLDFSDTGGSGGGAGWGRNRGHFGIWSLRFSGDGSEIVAGTSDQSVYVYDLEARRSILRIPGHQDDVNAVCFGDKMSPHILYSGSDDTTLKVWDRRSLASMRPAGMFLGHTEGITYIDSKGDGRYVISNAKDQTCKLWDLRKMVSTDKGERLNPQDFTTNFDYRFSPYDTEDHTPHPHDCSLVTFRGHRVLKTLIRCHFSPASSTDGRYIYSGSHDGKIYIWNLDGTEAGTINVLAATKNSRPVSDERFVDRYDYYGRGGVWKTIVRDASWHPSAPVIAATSWNGWDHGLGTCTVHSWNDGVETDECAPEDEEELKTGEAYDKAESLGSAPMGSRVTAQLQHDQRYYGTSATAAGRETRETRLRDRRGLGALFGNEDDDDE
ncbi:Putative WD40/YVTN repeat-like-containing domain superfamily [Septoria linicola]|uniref:WD40/YVTN repeat-like-containing domain superfamily n=1 Tax=Septoria linicola TaxID=215465 RepID=A0A9Q9AKD1_9PEZI|nr:putative WD40/YVTN repeat-like-containing domain superfamily [Septoria linicola]USW50630.1 Putative WD40/YVTN repeat-like-containing domain superfamily [Septoria linicola]